MSQPQDQSTPLASAIGGPGGVVIPASDSTEDFDSFQDKDLTWNHTLNHDWSDLDNELPDPSSSSPVRYDSDAAFTRHTVSLHSPAAFKHLVSPPGDSIRILSYPAMALHVDGFSMGSMEDDSTSEGEEWQPAMSTSDNSSGGEDVNSLDAADDDDNDSDPDYEAGQPIAGYCTNCTAPLYSFQCGDCGHHQQDDQLLLNPTSISAEQVTATHLDIMIVWDERMLDHCESKGQPHPERPDRLRSIMGQLRSSGITDRCRIVESRNASLAELQAVHEQETIDGVRTASQSAPATGESVSYLTSDTYINQHTWACALLAAGGAAHAAVSVVRGEASCSAAIIRPPGHHAESNVAMGFCFFNNAAVAARAAQAHGAKRVLILDWDVHHGNGTQHIFENDSSVLFISIHRHDSGSFYPGTGAASEIGEGVGRGYTVNIPWNGSRVGDGDYMAAFRHIVLPVATSYKPDLVIVSAGFDAAEGDPIGGCHVTPACFGWMTAQMKPIAPLVLLLEGGYNLKSIALSTEACLRALMGEEPRAPSKQLSLGGYMSLCNVHKVQCEFWPAVTMPVGEGVVTHITRPLQLLDACPAAVRSKAGRERGVGAHSHKERLRLQLKQTEAVRRRKRDRALQILWQVSRSAAKAWWRRQLDRKRRVRLLNHCAP